MLHVTIYRGFEKRENSTKIPSSSTPYQSEWGMLLKDGTSMHNPILQIEINSGTSSKIPTINYLYVDEFKRYYFVDDIVFDGHIAELHCSVDVLASYRKQIKESTQYVLRSASEFDGKIIDGLYPSKSQTNKQVVEATGGTTFYSDINDGMYIVSIVGTNTTYTTGGNGLNYYVLTPTEFITMVYAMATYSQDTMGLAKPYEYVKGVKWFPFNLPQTSYYSYGAGKVYLGSVANFPMTNVRVLKTIAWTSSVFTLNVPNHPQAADRGLYLNNSPYSRYMFFNPIIGEYPIDTNYVLNHSKMFFQFKVDCITGDAICQIFVTSNDVATTTPQHIVGQIQCQMGMDIAIGEIASKLYTAVDDIAATSASAASLDAMGTVTGIMSVADAIAPQVKVSGMQGSILPYQYKFKLRSEHLLLVDEDNADRGRPLMKKKTLSSLSGYVVCADADVELPATATENSKIKSYLNNGMFLE